MSQIEPGELKDILANARSIFRGTKTGTIFDTIGSNPDVVRGVRKYSDLVDVIMSLGGVSNTQDMNALSSALEFLDILDQSEGGDRVQYFEVRLRSYFISILSRYGSIPWIIHPPRSTMN